MTEAETILARAEAYLASDDCVRNAAYVSDLLTAKDGFDAYWAGSASASVIRDHKLGLV